MLYHYKSAWAVIGGISVSEGATVELYKTTRCTFLLTRHPDDLLLGIDRRSALARHLMKVMFGGLASSDWETALSSEIEEIRSERDKKLSGQPALIMEAQGEADVHIGQFKEIDDCIVTFDAFDQKTVMPALRSKADAMMLSVATESENPSRFNLLSEGIYFINDSGKAVYSLSFSMSGEASLASSLAPEGAQRITARYEALQRNDDLETVQRLFSQMANAGTDRLRTFLSGWAALEILIQKYFKSFEHNFLAPLAEGTQPNLRERFLQRIRAVMRDKYRLTDKFIVVAAMLFPTAPDADLERDCDTFSNLKRRRDAILHGEDVSEKTLPTAELAALLRRYLVARLDTAVTPM